MVRSFWVLLVSVTAVAPLAGANHSQAVAGGTLVFDHRTGNEWWVEVDLFGSAAGSVSRVEAMDTGGSWIALAKKSWGPWAASFHIEPGNQVRFRATWTSGAQVASCWFTHPQGAEQCGTPPANFDAAFANVKGNEWWVETKVVANQPVAKVQARDAPGPWRDLTLRSWGAWATSFQIPYGEKVQLRAQSTSGAWDYSANGWDWPLAIPYPAGGPGFTAHFEDVTGHNNRVQVNVYASEGEFGMGGVSVRVDDGAWQPLVRQSWGDWGLATSIPAGGHVQFGAASARGGAWAESGTFVWPQASPAPAWPQEGSFVRYDLWSHWRSGNYLETMSGTLHLTYEGGLWNAVCEGRTFEEFEDGTTEATDWRYETKQGPRQVSPTLPAGTTTNPRVVYPSASMHTCEVTEWIVRVEGEQWRQTSMEKASQPVFLRALVGREYPDGESSQDLEMSWEKRYGLVLDWHRSGRMSQMTTFHGALVDTDAPIR